jgi:hypothetical protein
MVRVCLLLTLLTATLSSHAQTRHQLPPLGQEHLSLLLPDAPQPSDKERAPKRLLFGLNVTTNETGIVAGSFSAGTEMIYFEVLRGEPNDSADADAPPYGLDIRIMDRDRTPFVVQTAGTAPLSPTWFADSLKAESLPIDIEGRQRAFTLFPRAARALRAYINDHPHLQAELGALVEVLEYYTLEDLQDIESAPDEPAHQITTHATAQAKYTHKVTIKKKRSNINLPRREYEHSALILQIYKQGGALLSSFHTSNHGTPATSSLMSTKCSKNFTKTNVSFNMWDIMCESYRSVWPVSHLCNDDTRQQYLSIKNSSSQNWGVCFGFRKYAPDCD